MDKILIGSQTFEEMYEKLEWIREVLQEFGLTLILDKCDLYKQSTFLGHKIHADGISPVEIKINIISILAKPTNVIEVRQFLILPSRFRKFVTGYAILLEPLRILLRIDKKFSGIAFEEPSNF